MLLDKFYEKPHRAMPLEKVFDTAKPSNTLEDIFITAVDNNTSFLIDVLLDWNKLDFESISKRKSWLLVDVASCGSVDHFKHLLGTGKFSIAAKNKDGQTPLASAAERGNTEIVQFLLDMETVDMDSRDFSESTLHSDTVEPQMRSTTKKPFHMSDMQVDTQDIWLRTPMISAAIAGHKSIVQMLIDSRKANVNHHDMYRRTALQYAAEQGHDSVVALLLKHVRDSITFSSRFQKTALHYAAEGGHAPVVARLLESDRVDIKFRCRLGGSALHYAAKGGNASVVELLLDSDGVDVNSSNVYKKTALHHAAERGDATIVALLLDRGVGVDVNYPDRLQKTALHYAAEGGHTSVVELLLDVPDIQVDVPNQAGRTALFLAAIGGCPDTLNLFLNDRRVNKETVDNWRWTPRAHVYWKIKTRKERRKILDMLLQGKSEETPVRGEKRKDRSDSSELNARKKRRTASPGPEGPS